MAKTYEMKEQDIIFVSTERMKMNIVKKSSNVIIGTIEKKASFNFSLNVRGKCYKCKTIKEIKNQIAKIEGA